jgi:aminoglycoside 6'-N-acetyltransferase
VTDPRVALRPTTDADLPRLVAIAREPAVAAHWTLDPDDPTAGLSSEDSDEERFTAFAITVDGDIVGFLGAWEDLDPQYRHAGIDLFLSTRSQGRGYGPAAIRLACRFLFDERGHHRVTIDPAADHVAAIRAYEKVGFRRIGVLRQYERGPDGTFHDGALLEMLRGELT